MSKLPPLKKPLPPLFKEDPANFKHPPGTVLTERGKLALASFGMLAEAVSQSWDIEEAEVAQQKSLLEQCPDAASFDLQRFVTAQQDTYEDALAELQRWQKKSHWMWFIFPQIDGLGGSTTGKHYAIKGRSEAEAYLEHPTLGPRLLSCCRAVLATHGLSASDIFGHPDDVKLKSSMTLFACISAPESVFSKVLNKFFAGQMDKKTVELLKLHP